MEERGGYEVPIALPGGTQVQRRYRGETRNPARLSSSAKGFMDTCTLKLDITILRPEEPGNLVTQSGDIDNRLKTLFDALTIPDLQQIPPEDSARDGERPFHCLLEDDNLITEVHVTVDRLLGSNNDPHQVLMIICVDVSATQGTMENLALIT